MVHLTRHRNTSVQAEGVRTIGRPRFEIRQRVSCPQSDKRLRYTVETWFFFPHSLQMNRWSYTPTDYQQSLKNYIRLGVPVHVLESLLGRDDPRFAPRGDLKAVFYRNKRKNTVLVSDEEEQEMETSVDAEGTEEDWEKETHCTCLQPSSLTSEEEEPFELTELASPAREVWEERNSEQDHIDLLEQCSRYLDAGLKEMTPASRERFELSLKLFCLQFRAALIARRKLVLAVRNREDQIRAALDMARTAAACLRRYRRLYRMRRNDARRLTRVPVFRFCDEYLSIIVTQVLGEVVRQLSAVHNCSTQVLAIYSGQRAYRSKRYPDSISHVGSDNELPVFRWSILKKYVDMPLFLNIQRKSGSSWIEHALQTVAAGAAMSGALLFTFLWQEFEAFRTQLALGVVLAYICRERIKEMFRSRLLKAFGRWIPDRLLYISDSYMGRLGRCAVSFRFVEWNRIPKTVRKLRNRTHFVDILNAFHNEDILYYAKTIDLRRLPDPFHEGRNLLLDISRFDISDFLRHADEVLEEPHGVSDESPLLGEKVYHVDMVRRITHGQGSDLERFRIVLTSTGIRRIDEIETLCHKQNRGCA